MLETSAVYCTTLVSISLPLLYSIFARVGQGKIWSIAANSRVERLIPPSTVLIEFKSVHAALKYFSTYETFPAYETSRVSFCSVALSMEYPDQIHSLVTPTRAFITETSHATCTRVNHPHSPRIPLVYRKFHSDIFQRTHVLWKRHPTNFFPITTILTPSGLTMPVRIPEMSHTLHTNQIALSGCWVSYRVNININILEWLISPKTQINQNFISYSTHIINLYVKLSVMSKISVSLSI